MKRYLFAIGVLSLAMWAGVFHGEAMAEDIKQSQTITRVGSQASVKGPAEYFTGNVWVEPLFGPKQPEAPFGAVYVTFEPGARSHWHTHPAGQHLIVTKGIGRTGTADGKIEEFRAGDTLWCPPDVKHWHGASPTTSMTHIALTNITPEGKNVKWMEEVTDQQYHFAK